jgi:hypothetical protein
MEGTVMGFTRLSMDDVRERFDGVLLADGFEDALIGFGCRCNTPVAIYDRQQCLWVLETRDKMSSKEALEFFEFNVEGSFVGDSTPVYLDCWAKEDVMNGKTGHAKMVILVEPHKETPPTSVPDPHSGRAPSATMKPVVEAASGPQPKSIDLSELFGGH